jgi:hypothetical protein
LDYFIDVQCTFTIEEPKSCVRVTTHIESAKCYLSRNDETCPQYLLETLFSQVQNFLRLVNIKRIVLKDVSVSKLHNANVIILTVLLNSLMIILPISVFVPLLTA